MNRRFWVVLTFAVLTLGSFIGHRHVSSIAAEPGASAAQSVPAEITKGTFIEFYQPAYPVQTGAYFIPTVEEVRGKWVLFKWMPNDLGKQQGYADRTFWV